MNRQLTPVVKNLIIINVLFFLVTSLNILPDQIIYALIGHYPASELFYPWQIVTHMFMHGGLFHILMNMFVLFMFGPMLEQLWGPKRFLVYYFVTGLGAVGLHYLVVYLQIQSISVTLNPGEVQEIYDNGASILMDRTRAYSKDSMNQLNQLVNGGLLGASGAVYGVLLGFGMLFPNTRLMLLFPPIPIKEKVLVFILGGVALFSAISNNEGDNVAHFAHLGGMLFGYLLLKYWQKNNGSFY